MCSLSYDHVPDQDEVESLAVPVGFINPKFPNTGIIRNVNEKLRPLAEDYRALQDTIRSGALGPDEVRVRYNGPAPEPRLGIDADDQDTIRSQVEPATAGQRSGGCLPGQDVNPACRPRTASGCRNPRRRGRCLVPSELELDRLIRDRHWPLDDHSHWLQQVSELGFRHAKGGIGAGWILGQPRGARAQDQYERYQYSGFGSRELGCLYIILHTR